MNRPADLTGVFRPAPLAGRPRVVFHIRRRVWLWLTLACLAIEAGALYAGYLIVRAAT